jgi:hypothetical protein
VALERVVWKDGADPPDPGRDFDGVAGVWRVERNRVRRLAGVHPGRFASHGGPFHRGWRAY